MKVAAVSSVFVAASAKKAGLSFVDSSCDDAKALGLEDSWYYNWNTHPDAKGPDCMETPRTAEFAPMFWSCTEDCSAHLPADYWSMWLKTGVKYLLGFNEPDNLNQSNMTPAEAAVSWISLQKIAAKFDPAPELVGPSMTHWSQDGSPWLDEFLGNCTALKDCDPSSIKYLGFHDYDGSPDQIIKNADGVFKKYGRKIWLTEFSVGSEQHRPTQDAFLKEIIPKLEAAESVFRYAWYSTRNAPADWVAESSLLPFEDPAWQKRSKHTCAEDELKWLSGASWGRGNLAQCAAKATDDADCVAPKTIVYENGGDNNCYCAKSSCTDTTGPVAQWQDRYILSDVTFKTFANKVCTSEDDMLWLNNGDGSTLEGCQAMAQMTGACAHPKTVAYESANHHNCYCSKTSTCDKVASDWPTLHVQTGDETSLELTSTGQLYAAATSAAVAV
jgi:hypothetical protein